ncbi:MAG TPA: DUF167 domain-containing protein [Nitrospiraceae bacterium]|nr:DUF167 domain-containing protein [Nitrospiraceae bacterium]
MSSPPIVQDSPAGAILFVHVQPKAARTEYVGLHGEALKVRVAAPPAEGAANEELCRFLAATFGLPRRAVEIGSGATGRRKRVLLRGVSAVNVCQAFGVSASLQKERA